MTLPARLPRDLHPVAWWLWALGLATAASLTTNPLVLLLLIGVAAARGGGPALGRSRGPGSFRLYVWLGVAIIVIRVVFRILFGGGYGGSVLLDLPEVPLPAWVAGITLLGPVTRESLLAGLYDGLRLGDDRDLRRRRQLAGQPQAAAAVGARRRSTRSAPRWSSRHVLPQLADSVRRVRAAQRLRGGETGRVGRLRRLLVPVLEDALERSLALAAGMDARGYGRAAGLTRRRRRTTGALMLGGLVGICVGRLRRARPHRAPRPGAADAGRSGSPSRSAGLARAPAAGSSAAATGPTRGAGRSSLVPPRGPVAAPLGWWVGAHQVLAGLPGASTRCRRLSGARAARPRASPWPARAARRAVPVARTRAARRRSPGAGRDDRAARRSTSATTTTRPSCADVDLTHRRGRAGPRRRAHRRRASRRCSACVTGLVPRFTGGSWPATSCSTGQHRAYRPPRERAHVVGYVGQDPAAGFVTDTVEEELAYGMEQLGLPPDDDAAPGRGDPRPARHRRPARPRPAHALGRRSSSGSPSARCSPCIRGCWCSTSRPRRSTRPRPRRCWPR